VLLVGDGDETTIGTPTVAGATVSATVLGEERGPKLVIFKFKQKVKYRRHTGHRQHLTRVRIDEITRDGRTAKVDSEATPARRGSRAAKAAGEGTAAAPDAASASEAPATAETGASSTAETEPKPRRARASASVRKAEAAKPADEKRATTRRAAPRKKAETEE
jgi:large subunit ribosomal protein L21